MQRRLLIPVTLLTLASILASFAGCQSSPVTTTITQATTDYRTITNSVSHTITSTVTTTITEVPTTTTTTDAPSTRTITDMFGRTVTVPAEINRVLTTGPVEMELVYMLAPDKLAGLAFTFNGTTPYIPENI